MKLWKLAAHIRPSHRTMRRTEKVAGDAYLLTVKQAAYELALPHKQLKALILAGKGPKAVMASPAFIRVSRQAIEEYKAQRAA